jgi:hypothetical protein
MQRCCGEKRRIGASCHSKRWEYEKLGVGFRAGGTLMIIDGYIGESEVERVFA